MTGLLVLSTQADADEFTAPTAQATPVIACDQPIFDFGVADPEQPPLRHTFLIRNTGQADLIIRDVKAACGCTVAQLKQTTIPPGKSAPINAALKLKGRRGPQNRTITVYSNDPDTPELKLGFKGTAQSPLQTRPSSVYFGNVPIGHTGDSEGSGDSGGDRLQRTVEIDVAENVAFTIRSVESGSAAVKATAQTVIEGTAYRINLQLKPNTAGPLDTTVTVHTTSHRFPQIKIPVSAIIQAAIAHTPSDLLLPAEVDQPMVRYVLLNGQPGQPFKITSVQTPSDAIKTHIQPIGKRGYRLRISGLTPEPDLAGQAVVIHTDLPQQPTVRLSIRILTPPPATTTTPTASTTPEP